MEMEAGEEYVLRTPDGDYYALRTDGIWSIVRDVQDAKRYSDSAAALEALDTLRRVGHLVDLYTNDERGHFDNVVA
jgi:serine/threonine protein phosphatase PrpC